MTILDRIIDDKRREVAALMRARPIEELERKVRDLPPASGRSFPGALKKKGRGSLSAELKKASPSAGVFRRDFDPVAIAQAYKAGGADALSVLTERKYFQGADQYLVQARKASGLPVLRKDFFISPWQLYESRLLGADCVLLITAVLEDGPLAEFLALADELALDALVEVHDSGELERAIASKARIIGVNNRNLHSFEVSLEVSAALSKMLPESAVKVSESGISSHRDIRRLEALGYDAVLVGEHLMRQQDVATAVRTFMQGEP